jgi:hypothetical protein
MHFQVLPLPVAPGPVYSSYLQLGLLQYLKIPYPEYLSGRAAMETQTENSSPASSSTSSWSTYCPSVFNMLPEPGEDCGIFALDKFNRRYRYDSFGFVKKRSKCFMNLDFEDAIFIPNFCNYDQAEIPHAGVLHQQMESSSPVRPQHVRPRTLVTVGCQADVWKLGPQHLTIPVSERPIDIRVLTASTTTPESGRSLSINLPNWRTHSWNQASSWRTPPSSQAPLTPPSSTPERSSRTPQRADVIARELMAERERINKQSGSGTSRLFIPSRVVQERNSPESLSPHTLPLTPTRLTRYSNHYGRSDVPPNQNCAIYVVGIPAVAQYADVLGSIRGGKILICLIDRPNEQHPTAAAKIVFFTRASAELFMQRSCGIGVYILGQRVTAVWNRIHYAAHAKANQSRVVLISGPACWMDFEFFENFFRARFEFQEESRSEMPRSREGHVVHMWRFASLRAQAELAYIAIERELGGIFKVEYGPDLCARPWI